ncbi:hypothetical protein B0I35DRAFT_424113 [Stachybotrys elegans]|uniref:2-oxoadipate dioxygenase/decarboxylase n=1 Tax=Stachybotrys elegans TaxID=80388 RepID=A0A8K0STA8_9HYPO|nr:hypothetical protein B0I35DRAFT_424113 [Stachybotrys elegans]
MSPMIQSMHASEANRLAPEHNAGLVDSDDLRTAFAIAMSQMYKNEVPLYGDLIRIVQGVNKEAYSGSLSPDSLDRLTLERHGAIRLGLPEELRTVRRLFSILGMKPVGYYDLSTAGLPMHATCFRPTAVTSLARNPFRVFTTLLRPEMIRSEEARDLAMGLLRRRSIFSDELMQVMGIAESQGGLYADEAEVFIREAIKTFCWAPVAAATAQEYQVLKAQHPILADIACFKTAHINHLTPRTLNITAAQKAMGEEGMAVKDRIEGPPARRWPVLLRQTSFLALEEAIKFQTCEAESSVLVPGSHKARFGEIEERGAAVTPSGRKLYDELLVEAMKSAQGHGPEAFDEILESTFKQFPDDWDRLRKQGLVYCEYQHTGKPIPDNIIQEESNSPSTIEKLVEAGVLRTVPITYEDFLPFSAAGIFQSNLSGKSNSSELGLNEAAPDQEGMETALGVRIVDPDDLYSAAQQSSLQTCLSRLGVSM